MLTMTMMEMRMRRKMMVRTWMTRIKKMKRIFNLPSRARYFAMYLGQRMYSVKLGSTVLG